MNENKGIVEHLSDFGEGIYDILITTPYNFGDFLGRISGLRDQQHGSIVIKDYYQQEAIEEFKIFWSGITNINSWDRAKTIFNLVKKDMEERPMYYLGSFGISGFVSSTIKTGSKIVDIGVKGIISYSFTLSIAFLHKN